MLKVFNKYYTIRNLLFFIIEGCLIYSGILVVVFGFYQGSVPVHPEYMNLWLRVLIVTLIVQLSLYYNDLYDFSVKRKVLDLSLRIIQAIGVSCLLLAALYYIFPAMILEQGIFFFAIFVYQILCQKKLFNVRFLMIGDGELAELISREVSSLDSGYTLTGIFSNPQSSGLSERLGVPHRESYDHLSQVAQDSGARTLVMALQERRGRSPIQELLNCRLQGIKVMDGVSFYEHLSGKVLATQAPPSWLIYSDGFRRHPIIRIGKRSLDVLFALLGLILSAPLFAACAMAIKATSRGPVFFKQNRVGQKEQTYKVYKFRTMRDDAEEKSGAVWATEEDPRITRVGHILRKFRFDEIPQFWNVLKGEMSFVGPRPERPEFVDQLKQKIPYYSERHSVKPGITGWAQVNYPYGASEEDALRKLEYDLFYIKNLSLLFDLYIVLKTVKTVIVGKGAR
jgi:sugar transferase (PEP-CTERM system associated)